MPISRVRSVTETNMMFITPTPPIASVSTPMNAQDELQAVRDAADLLRCFASRHELTARSSVGLKPWRVAEDLAHLLVDAFARCSGSTL